MTRLNNVFEALDRRFVVAAQSLDFRQMNVRRDKLWHVLECFRVQYFSARLNAALLRPHETSGEVNPPIRKRKSCIETGKSFCIQAIGIINATGRRIRHRQRTTRGEPRVTEQVRLELWN